MKNLLVKARSREIRIMLACPRLQPIPEGRPCRLTRSARVKEEPEQLVSGGRPKTPLQGSSD